MGCDAPRLSDAGWERKAGRRFLVRDHLWPAGSNVRIAGSAVAARSQHRMVADEMTCVLWDTDAAELGMADVSSAAVMEEHREIISEIGSLDAIQTLTAWLSESAVA